MREFNHDGLVLAEFQGKLFEKSYDLSCSSKIFIRRFLHSEQLKVMDLNNPAILSLDVDEAISNITKQFGDTDYGKIKFSPSALFWMGYMYRYISYTREQPTPFVMKLFSCDQMNDTYYAFHTQDPEWCIQSLLEINNLTENIFDNNYRLKQIIKSKGIY